MPALTNHRQERFCQLVKQGIAPFKAYPMAGYAANSGSPYRLQDNARIKRRIAELHKGMAMKTRVTVQTISEQLDAVYTGATADKQFGPAHAAAVSKAKLHGLIVDRKESGQPGDFAGLTTSEDVLAMVRSELGAEAADALALAIARREAEQAAPAEPGPVLPAIDASRAPGDALN